jgi:hypothetical protein
MPSKSELPPVAAEAGVAPRKGGRLQRQATIVCWSSDAKYRLNNVKAVGVSPCQVASKPIYHEV